MIKERTKLVVVLMLMFLIAIVIPLSGCFYFMEDEGLLNERIDEYPEVPLISLYGLNPDGSIRASAFLRRNSEPFEITLAFMQISPTFTNVRRILIDVISTSKPVYILSSRDGVPFKPGRVYEFWLEYSKANANPKSEKEVWSTKHHTSGIFR